MKLTVDSLRDIVSRAASVLREDEHADENLSLIQELESVELLCQRVVGGSHMGTAADEPLLEYYEDGEQA